MKVIKGMTYIAGSALGAGAVYLVSYPIVLARNLYEQLPAMLDGRVAQGLCNTFNYSCQGSGKAALVGGVAGLLITIYGIDWIQSILGIKKR